MPALLIEMLCCSIACVQEYNLLLSLAHETKFAALLCRSQA